MLLPHGQSGSGNLMSRRDALLRVPKLDRSLREMGRTKARPSEKMFYLLRPQRFHRIHAGSAASGDKAGHCGYQSEQAGDGQVNSWIERLDLEQDVLKRGRGQHAEEQSGCAYAEDKADRQLPC